MGRYLGYFTVLMLLTLLMNNGAMAQTSNSKTVIVKRSDSLQTTIINGVQLKKLIGNVALVQGNVQLFSDLVLQDEAKNTMQAFGNVRIIQGDSVTLTGDTALYYGNTRLAKISGRSVVLNDGTITLTTRRLDYNLGTHVAFYTQGGTILDKQSVLTSREGFYNTQTKLFLYRYNVRVVDPQSIITADSLRYSTLSKEAFFIAPTKIVSKTDTLFAKGGSYNVNTQLSNFKGRSTVRTPQFDLTADTLNYDKPTQIGIARGHVIFQARSDSAILTGRVGRYYGQQGVTRVWGNPLMRSIRQKDTLYLTADTLVLREIITAKDTVRRLYAYRNVLIYKTDLQGKCDSLAYYVSDSTLFFFKKPILWNQNSQSEGDSIQIKLHHGAVNLMLLRGHSFIISLDTLKEYNQVKGKRITANFDRESHLERVFVEGNGESIYYALDEKNKLIGMNRVESGKMTLSFQNNEVKRIVFAGNPDASLTPPSKITAEGKTLDGFNWRERLRPTRAQVVKGSTLEEPASASTGKLVLAKPEVKPKPKEKPLVKGKKAPAKTPVSKPKSTISTPVKNSPALDLKGIRSLRIRRP